MPDTKISPPKKKWVSGSWEASCLSTRCRVCFVAALAHLQALAGPSNACGRYSQDCSPVVFNSTSTVYVTTTLTLNAYTFPAGQDTTTGTFGQLSIHYIVYPDPTCTSSILDVLRLGEWQDLGSNPEVCHVVFVQPIFIGLILFPYIFLILFKNYTKLVFDATVTQVTPRSDDVTNRLGTSCSCFNASGWATGQMRIITVCPGVIDCSLPWISLVSPGSAQYGLALVFLPFHLWAHSGHRSLRPLLPPCPSINSTLRLKLISTIM